MKTDKQTVYIAGPMRGIKLFNFPAFDEAKENLIKMGYDVISPADIDRECGFDPINLPYDWDWNVLPNSIDLEVCYQRDLNAVRQADAICMLDGWEKSKGAKAELACAEWLDKAVLLESYRTVEPAVGGPKTSPFPTESQERLKYPVFSGVMMYFPDAIAALAKHSLDSFKQHNPDGGPIWWDPSKSIGTLDQLTRHSIDAQVAFSAGDFKKAEKEAAAVHWRAAELHQRMLKGMPPFER